MAARDAPSAVRSATSRARPAARASNRLATFAHAINRMIPTAPISRRKAPRNSPIMSSRIGRAQAWGPPRSGVFARDLRPRSQPSPLPPAQSKRRASICRRPPTSAAPAPAAVRRKTQAIQRSGGVTIALLGVRNPGGSTPISCTARPSSSTGLSNDVLGAVEHATSRASN